MSEAETKTVEAPVEKSVPLSVSRGQFIMQQLDAIVRIGGLAVSQQAGAILQTLQQAEMEAKAQVDFNKDPSQPEGA
jgi:hypothetical protein